MLITRLINSLIKTFYSKSLTIALSLIKMKNFILLLQKGINEQKSIFLPPNNESHTDKRLFLSSVVGEK